MRPFGLWYNLALESWKRLKWSKDADNSDRYVLELSEPHLPLTDECFKSACEHFYNIGILLLELGIGEPVINALSKIEDEEPDIMTQPRGSQQHENENNRNMNPVQWQAQLKRYTGDKFVNAVKYCLSRHRESQWRQEILDLSLPLKSRETAFKEILKEYYIQVCKP